MSRAFTHRQRAALYLAAGGKCSACGADLAPGWHADHKQPWSKGGDTDVINGQALCPSCNLKKGSKMATDPRKWQELARRQYHTDSKPDWLLYATPGAGKTRWGLNIASELLQTHIAERVVVVVPTDVIRTQWTQQKIIDLAIVSNSDGGMENRADFKGQVVTYAQVANSPLLYRMACSRFRTAVLFDEVHHAGDSSSWGQSIEEAFGLAERRILMTGTPWRAPHRGKIPFVKYDPRTNEVKPDFRFGYSDAVRAGVCRPVQFHAFDGEVTYVNIDSCSPQIAVVRLGDVEDDTSSILRDILRPEGNWMQSILREAARTLEEIRCGDEAIAAIPDAKGLIVVHDRTEARAVVKLISRITRERAALIISDPEDDEPDPQEELARFRKNQQRWAVAVDMVSEGVDIPALYVGVYATRKKTPLRFQQIVGRFVRQRPGDDSPAVLFVPAVQSILSLASSIEKDLLQVIEDEEAEEEERQKRGPRAEGEEPQIYVRGTSEAELDRIIHQGNSYSEAELRAAAADIEEFGFPARLVVKLAEYRRAHGLSAGLKADPTPAQPEPAREMTKQEEWTMRRSLLDKEIGRVAAKFLPDDIGQAKRDINARIMGWFNKPRKDMSIEELRDALLRVRKLLEGARL